MGCGDTGRLKGFRRPLTLYRPVELMRMITPQKRGVCAYSEMQEKVT